MESITFSKTDEFITVYEISDKGLCGLNAYKSDDNTYMINKVNIPPALRNQGICTKLINALIEDSDKSNYLLKLDVLPYPYTPDFTVGRLTNFYKRFGFEQSETHRVLVRYPKNQELQTVSKMIS